MARTTTILWLLITILFFWGVSEAGASAPLDCLLGPPATMHTSSRCRYKVGTAAGTADLVVQ